MIRYSLYVIAIFSILFSCKSDDEGRSEDINGKVLILNEGNFGFGNASISLYNTINNEVSQKIFQANNDGRPIGDVIQSAIEIEDKIYIVVNNSSKIEVITKSDFKYAGSITGLNSPRYILPIHQTKAYVSDLYEDKIYVIDPMDYRISSTIDSKGWVEEMLLFKDKAFVCHMDSNQIWVLDVNTDQVLAKINTHVQPQHIEIDNNEKLWVSCSGGLNGDTAALYRIDPITYQVEQVLTQSDNTISLGEIETNKAGNQLYYLSNGDVFKIQTDANTLAQEPIIKGANRLFYGISIDPETDDIYLCDAIDYLQRGVVSRYNVSLQEINTFKVGIIPGDILFLKE